MKLSITATGWLEGDDRLETSEPSVATQWAAALRSHRLPGRRGCDMGNRPSREGDSPDNYPQQWRYIVHAQWLSTK
jgi:hypothetical protein